MAPQTGSRLVGGRVFLDGDMERDFLIITHDDHRNFRSRADLGHLIHRLQCRDGGFVIHGDDYVVGADPGLRRWTVRGDIVNDDPLNLIDPSALRVQRAISWPLMPI